MARIFDSPKNPKDANDIDLSRSSHSDFSLTTGMTSSLTISIESITFIECSSFQQKFTPTLGSEFWVCGRFQNVLTLINLLNIQTFLLNFRRLDSLRQGLNRKIYTCRAWFVSRINYIGPWLWFLIVWRISQNLILILIVSQYSKTFFSLFRGLFPCI